MNTELPNFDLVLFGGTGDLATRKILVALFNAHNNGNIANNSRIIIIGRKDFTNNTFKEFAFSRATNAGNNIEPQLWNNFSQIITYLQLDAVKITDYQQLKSIINTNIVNIFYLSTAPDLFKPICENLAQIALNHPNARIVLEKPLGNNLKSAIEINDVVAKFFTEQQIYRIDHYLGKESVQNLMAIRFGNTLFEALWRRQWISSVQITIAEKIGAEFREEFYDKTGALRDMLQNHLLQLLCIVAMEPPFSLDADVVRDEKLKVLQSLKLLDAESVLQNVVSGQYQAGVSNHKQVKGYVEGEAISQTSVTETFVALKAEVNNWRWAGVPFYLRTGKRLAAKTAEIIIQFKDIPCKIFPFNANNFANRLIIKLQPEETVQFYFLAKKPGDTNELKPVYLDLDFNKMFATKSTDAYERLLLEVIRGRLTLFVRRDEQESAWRWVEPILQTWERLVIQPKPYASGSWGPIAASAMLARDGNSWHEDSALDL